MLFWLTLYNNSRKKQFKKIWHHFSTLARFIDELLTFKKTEDL